MTARRRHAASTNEHARRARETGASYRRSAARTAVRLSQPVDPASVPLRPRPVLLPNLKLNRVHSRIGPGSKAQLPYAGRQPRRRQVVDVRVRRRVVSKGIFGV